MLLSPIRKRVQKPFDSGTLRVVAFSDYRVQDHSLLFDFVSNLQPAPNLIVYAGDDVERFHTESRNFFEELAALSTHGMGAVIGNDDPMPPDGAKSPRACIRGNNVFEVHETPLVIGDYAVIGSEAAAFDKQVEPIGLCYTEKVVASHLARAARAVKGKRLIVVSHTPPRGTLDPGIRFSEGRNIGSAALRNFLRKRRDVVLVVCGHVHSCGAKSRKLNRCLVVNAASHDWPGEVGRVAVIDIAKGAVRNIEWHFLQEELYSVSGIREGRARRLYTAGIRTLVQLTALTDEQLKGILKCSMGEASSIRIKALALLTKEAVFSRAPDVPPSNSRVYLDIETDHDCKWIWLIGVHFEHQNRTYPFFANDPQDEVGILRDFIALAASYPDLPMLTFSNCSFEQRMLEQRLAAHSLGAGCVSRIRDLYSEIHSCAAFPVQSSSVKDISQFAGFKPRTDLDGFAATYLYGSGGINKRTKERLLKYNEDDLLALKHVVLYLEANSPGRALAAQASLY